MPTVSSMGDSISPEQVKASFILQMRKFVMFDSPPHTLRMICYYEKSGISEDESVGQILEKYFHVHPEASLSIKRIDSARNFNGCDILYIPEEEDANISTIVTNVGTNPILLISDTKRFIFRGGMIGFVLDDASRVRMEANLKNLKANNVNVDSQLLEVMSQVVSQ